MHPRAESWAPTSGRAPGAAHAGVLGHQPDQVIPQGGQTMACDRGGHMFCNGSDNVYVRLWAQVSFVTTYPVLAQQKGIICNIVSGYVLQ